MAEEGKKISFGFSKSIKKPVLTNVKEPEIKKVDFIECLDGKSIKVVGGEEKQDGPLVIPMLGSRTWHDRIVNKVDADIFEPKVKNEENGENGKNADERDSRGSGIPNGTASNNKVPMEAVKIKKEPVEEMPVSLEEQAAQEILKELGKEVKVEPKDLTLPLKESDNLEGQREATLEDYEQIPIESYGLAMLRGMGWKPGKGLGKNDQCVAPKLPELRPRGMGLGADKAVLKAKNVKTKTKEQEQLTLIVGAFVKILGGKYNHNYGVLEGLDEDTGRLIVKLTIGGESVSLNESLVEPVTKDEYTKNSKVLNASKYAEYKNKDNVEKTKSELNSNSSDTKKRKSDDSSDDDRRSRRRKTSTSSSEDHYERKSKKKHKNRDRSSSSEGYRKKSKKHSSRKSKKKEKTLDKSREKKAEYSESLDRRKSKKHHKRSRS